MLIIIYSNPRDIRKWLGCYSGGRVPDIPGYLAPNDRPGIPGCLESASTLKDILSQCSPILGMSWIHSILRSQHGPTLGMSQDVPSIPGNLVSWISL